MALVSLVIATAYMIKRYERYFAAARFMKTLVACYCLLIDEYASFARENYNVEQFLRFVGYPGGAAIKTSHRGQNSVASVEVAQ